MKKREGWPRVAVGVPMERTVSQSAFFNFIALAQLGYPFIKQAYTRIDIARNQFAQHILDHDKFTHLVMLDLDHAHPPDIIARLTRWVREDPDKLVIGGLHFRRGAPYEPCVYVQGSDGEHYTLERWDRGLLKVSAMGLASVLVAREVFERIPGPWFTFSYPDNGCWPGEDLSFCEKCREHNIDLYVDTTATSPHLIDSFVTENTFRSWLAVNAEKEDGIIDQSMVKVQDMVAIEQTEVG